MIRRALARVPVWYLPWTIRVTPNTVWPLVWTDARSLARLGFRVTVQLASGNYYITDTVNVPRRTTLVGTNPGPRLTLTRRRRFMFNIDGRN